VPRSPDLTRSICPSSSFPLSFSLAVEKEEENASGNFIQERMFGQFERTVNIPLHTEMKDVEAEFANGVYVYFFFCSGAFVSY
jgi:hypothetical protein